MKAPSNKFNKKHVPEEQKNDAGLHSLSKLYNRMFGEDFAGAHDALNDARAGGRVALHHEFWSRRFQQQGGIFLVQDLFAKKKISADKVTAGVTHPLHPRWTEQKPEDGPVPSAPPYHGAKSGPRGDAAAPKETLADYLLDFLPLAELKKIVGWSTNYGRRDWVKKDARRNTFTPCSANDPAARHRFEEHSWVPMDEYMLLAGIGLMVRSGAQQWRTRSQAWCTEFSIGDPVAAATMTSKAYDQILRAIHFCDNEAARTNLASGAKDPLFKVRFIVDLVGTRLRMFWTLGQNLCVDESMIRCKSGWVTFVQYMPAKPM